MIDIAVVDYGMGNLRSVSKALEHVAADKKVVVTSNPQDIAEAERVVFPGQGAMPDCVRELDSRGLREAVIAAAASKPFLGICIGLQLLFDHSEEGNADGLGIFSGQVKRFSAADMHDAQGHKLKVPHMGWNEVYQSQSHPLWAGIENGERFYYVHSYYVAPQETALMAGYSEYPKRFTSVVAKDNIFAVQFHPEKSQHAGLKLLSNFVQWNGHS
ncbi:MAG: imidazole glycerol phosphate synthase subunit HisH [Methylophilaceae bacterium]|jgi:glutamine amidotransferase|nr:imidazole glycerol phosphate synthase subunit HisH [Methyloradius sp.]